MPKFGTKLQFEYPEECPKDCSMKPEYFYQGCSCTRCPVFSCKEYPDIGALVPADQFRDDWAEEWDKFFKTGEEPKLYLIPKEENKC